MKNKYKTILIFGLPGVGKSTQAKLLDNSRFYYVSSGEFLRTLENDTEFENSDLGEKISQTMSSGGLISDSIITELLFNNISEAIKKKMFDPNRQILVLDGMPRNASQADLIDNQIEVIKIIYIYSSDDSVLANRITKRAKLEQREDDQDIRTFKKRLAVYKSETEEVLNHYPKEIIDKVDGINTIEEISRQIKKILNNIGGEMDNPTQDPKFTKWHGIDRDTIDWHPTIDESKCIGCGTCATTCSRDVYKFDCEAKKSKVVNPNHCLIACQTCGNLCPVGAISFAENETPREKAQKIVKENNILPKVKEELEKRKDELKYN